MILGILLRRRRFLVSRYAIVSLTILCPFRTNLVMPLMTVVVPIRNRCVLLVASATMVISGERIVYAGIPDFVGRASSSG